MHDDNQKTYSTSLRLDSGVRNNKQKEKLSNFEGKIYKVIL